MYPHWRHIHRGRLTFIPIYMRLRYATKNEHSQQLIPTAVAAAIQTVHSPISPPNTATAPLYSITAVYTLRQSVPMARLSLSRPHLSITNSYRRNVPTLLRETHLPAVCCPQYPGSSIAVYCSEPAPCWLHFPTHLPTPTREFVA
jgi:hypothetical protein